ncbi:MAG: helix-turn-helix transcriptional regulator [Bacteriovoracaceae bacterium]|nr:helix-turn-helix transcriptional regulator [Bacteriovoracaceae bacterium]
MAQFNNDKIDLFLGVVRKYMQVRGPMSQKELAEVTEVGVSTMSRFLNQKTGELNPQLIAKIVAKLNIPMHEIIDFVEEDYSERFIRLVRFFKNDEEEEETLMSPPHEEASQESSGAPTSPRIPEVGTMEQELVGALGMAKRKVTANVSAGPGGTKRAIHFGPDHGNKNSELSLKEKLESLTPRQKAYMTDFLSLDMEGRDLMVDMGNSFFRFMRIKGMEQS